MTAVEAAVELDAWEPEVDPLDVPRIDHAVKDLMEWLADPATPRFVSRTLTAQQEEGNVDLRFYPDPIDPALRLWSVTWILSGTHRKTWLELWHSRATAQFAVARWAELGEVLAAKGEKYAVKWLQHVALMRRSVASEAGRWQHDVLEALILDHAIPDPPEWLTDGMVLNDEPLTQRRLDRWADGLMNFWTDFRPEPIMSEATVCSRPEQIAGTLDAGFLLPHYGLSLVDLKTGKILPDEVPIQLEAYARMPWVVLPLGGIAGMPRFETHAVLHLRAEYKYGYKLLPQPRGDKQWGEFLDAKRRMQSILEYATPGKVPAYPARFGDDGRMYPPSEIPMIEDLGTHEGQRFPKAALRKAGIGITWLDELTQFTAEDLQSNRKTGGGVKGLGPAGIKAVRATLARYGLALRGEGDD